MVKLERMRNRVVVLDTCAFIMDYDPLAITEEQYTVPQVMDELSPNSIGRLRLRIGVDQGRIKLRTPRSEYVKKVEDYSMKMGDHLRLSSVDKLVLALALELESEGGNVLLLSDDYSVQNVADSLGMEHSSLTTLGIRYRFRWELYCPACHKAYPLDCRLKVCEMCGTKLKRRVKGKSRLRSARKAD